MHACGSFFFVYECGTLIRWSPFAMGNFTYKSWYVVDSCEKLRIGELWWPRTRRTVEKRSVEMEKNRSVSEPKISLNSLLLEKPRVRTCSWLDPQSVAAAAKVVFANEPTLLPGEHLTAPMPVVAEGIWMLVVPEFFRRNYSGQSGSGKTRGSFLSWTGRTMHGDSVRHKLQDIIPALGTLFIWPGKHLTEDQ